MLLKEIEGYPNYTVSNTGQVYNKKGVCLKQTIHNGYCIVYLYRNNVKKNFSVHRLVASAFLPNPKNLPEINHKDEDKTNNNVNNLEWCTHDYNMHYGTVAKKISSAKIDNTENAKTVYQYSKDGSFIKKWVSANQVERVLGYCARDIRKCCCGDNKYAYGFIWTEIPNYDAKNHIIRKNNKSGVIGVCFHKRDRKWQAIIMVNRKKIHLGTFNNKDDAIKSRLQAEYNLLKEKAPQKHLFNKYNIKEEGK